MDVGVAREELSCNARHGSVAGCPWNCSRLQRPLVPLTIIQAFYCFCVDSFDFFIAPFFGLVYELVFLTCWAGDGACGQRGALPLCALSVPPGAFRHNMGSSFQVDWRPWETVVCKAALLVWVDIVFHQPCWVLYTALYRQTTL